MSNGLVHFYLGNGKGKTTAIFGLALRALGREFNVLIVQVLKAKETGEILYLNNLNDDKLKLLRINSSPKFSWEMNEDEKQQSKNEIKLALEELKNEINNYDLVIFDEFLNAQSINFIDEFDIINLIENKKESQELAFTGRKTSDNLKSYADYISNIISEKHPYEKGIPARIGIEF